MRPLFHLCAAVTVLATSSCASMFLHGGKLVDRGDSLKTLVQYRTEGAAPAGVQYSLVTGEDGQPALFERSADGSGALIHNRWTENGEDHFFCWVGSSHGYEYVIPLDRTKPGRKYLYPFGYFTTEVVGGIEKPRPVAAVDPVASLIPN